MNSKRPVILMGILLVALLGFVSKPWWLHETQFQPPNHNTPPLAGKNAITLLKIENDTTGIAFAEFDYFYTGDPEFAVFVIALENGRTTQTAGGPPASQFYPQSNLKRGNQHVRVTVNFPGAGVQSTTAVTVQLQSRGNTLASQRIEHTIEWTDWQTWYRNKEFANMSTEALLNRAVEMIDLENEGARGQAKTILENILRRDPRFSQAYTELARIAMKNNWGPEGLHQAENLLASALQIDAKNVNAKVLLAYVYVHQKKFPQAESLYEETAATDTKNLWLWADWGELLQMQGDSKGAEAKFRETIKRPMGHDTYDRARLQAYRDLLVLVARRNDLDDTEALYKQRAEEFNGCSCYTEYAKFLIQQRGDTSAAIALTQRAIASGNDVDEARRIMGVAHYLNWINDKSAEKNKELNQARVYLPEGPMAIYLLSAHDRTAVAAIQLIRNGEKIDQLDNEKMTALALALSRKDTNAAHRLLRMGARASSLAGFDDMPVALIPVLSKDIASIKMLQEFGVDYSTLRYRGRTAIEFAKQEGDDNLLKVLKIPRVAT